MTQHKYLFLYRTPAQPSGPEPSPQQIQEMLAQWDGWKNKFKDNILDVGDGLKPGGKVLKGGVVTDGPYVESKEVMGGYSIVAAESYERALEVARECPINFMGARIEIRELAGY